LTCTALQPERSAGFSACTSPASTGTLADGSHTFRVRAIVGPLVDPAPATATWTIDTSPPAAAIVSTPANGSRTGSSRPPITGSAEANSTVTVLVDGLVAGTTTATASGAFSFTPATLVDGTHVVSASARDAAGNISAGSTFNVFTVDTTAPLAPVVLVPANGGTVGSATPTVSGTAEPASTVTLTVDGMTAGTVTADTSGAFSLTVPFALIAGPHTVSARATDAVGNQGPASTPSTFTVDLTLLDTTISSGPAALTNSATATFVLAANKPSASFECDLDNGGFTACGNPAVFAGLSEGTHTVRVRATRGAEVDPTPASASWVVDTTSPQPPFISSPATGATLSTARPTIAGTGTSAEVVSVIIDSVEVGTATVNSLGQWSFTLPTALAEGAHSVRASARDAAGNFSASSAPLSFTVDTTPPLPPLVSSPVAGSTLASGTPTYAGSSEPNSAVSVEVDGVVVGTVTTSASGQWTLLAPSPLTDGPHSIRARATDAIGNDSAPGPAVAFSVDSTAPSVPTFSAPSSGAFVNTGRPLLQGSADPGSVVTLRVDGTIVGTTVASSTRAFTFALPSALTEGPHQVTAQAADAVGNTSSVSASRPFTVDTVAPAAPAVSEPASLATIGLTSPTVRGTAEANAIVTVIIDSVVAGTAVADSAGAWSFTTAPLSEGQHSVSGTARDAAGNSSPAATQVLFTVDTTVTDTSILTGPRTPTNASTAAFSFSSNKSPVTFECRLDGAAFASCSNPASFTGLTDGPHRLEVRARFSATDIDASAASFVWTVDTVVPLAPVVVSPQPGAVLGTSTVTVSGTAEAGSTVTIIVDSGIAGTVTADASGAFSFTLPTTLADGAHTLSTRATDVADNTGPVSAVATFTVDTVAPVAPTLTQPAPNTVFNVASPSFSGTAEAGSTVTVNVDGASVGTVVANSAGRWTLVPTSPLADGAHTASATSRDVAGNLSPSSSPTTFTTDTTPPAGPVVTQPTAASTTSDSTPTIQGTAEAGTTVAIEVDGVTLGTTVADAAGTFSLTPTAALGEGPHTVTARATDGAGNTSVASTAVSFTVDTTPPAAPVIVTPANGATIATATPTISGTAEPFALVRLLLDGMALGTATADASGAFSFVVLPGQALGEGPHVLRADAADAASNRGPSATSLFTVALRTDAGTDGGLIDAGTVADGGVDDAGVSDAGLADAGTAPGDAGAAVEDAGVEPLLPSDGSGRGCGCTSADAGSLFTLSALLLSRLRRRRGR